MENDLSHLKIGCVIKDLGHDNGCLQVSGSVINGSSYIKSVLRSRKAYDQRAFYKPIFIYKCWQALEPMSPLDLLHKGMEAWALWALSKTNACRLSRSIRASRL